MALKEKEIIHLPHWLKRNVLLNEASRTVHTLVQEFNLNTVCQSARCPNKNECFANKIATFMILGNVCTRGCTFCSVPNGKPAFLPDEDEPKNIAMASKTLGLQHIVITSVNRDDLPDQGSLQFAKVIFEIKKEIKDITIEVLTPDFRGDKECIKRVVDASPDIYNHNLETVPRLYKKVRPGAVYKRSLELIKYVKELNPSMITKSGIMVGLGETFDEVVEVINDLYKHTCDYLTIGQYMQPTKESLQVERFLLPKEFLEFKKIALKIGFKKVFSGPLVRSSYHAGEFHKNNEA